MMCLNYLVEGAAYHLVEGVHRREEGGVVIMKKKSRDHVIVSSGWWSCQAGRAEGGGSGTRDELGALHSALREQAPSTGPIQLIGSLPAQS